MKGKPPDIIVADANICSFSPAAIIRRKTSSAAKIVGYASRAILRSYAIIKYVVTG